MTSTCPASMWLGFAIPLAEAKAETVVPKRAASPERVSPNWTVYDLVEPVAETDPAAASAEALDADSGSSDKVAVLVEAGAGALVRAEEERSTPQTGHGADPSCAKSR